MANLSKRLSFFLRHTYSQAALVGFATILPFFVYILATDSIIAPINIVSGWDVSASGTSVVAPIPSDITQQMLPFREYTKDALVNHHEIPLWNNRSFAGDIFLANPINTVLSPFNFLLFFVDIYTFQNIIVLFGIFFMSACMYLLLRQLRLSISASIIGSLAFSLAPFSIFWSIYGIVSIPMGIIPLVLYFYDKWKQQAKPLNLYVFLIAVVLAFAIYTGHIQIAILPYIILFLAVCYDLIFSKLSFKKAIYIGGGVLIAIMMGAAQIIPMAVQTPQSHRAQETLITEPRPWTSRLTELAKIPSTYDLSSGPRDLGVTNRRELSIGQIPGILFIISVGIVIAKISTRRRLNGMLFYFLLFILGAMWQWNDFPQTLLNSISPTFRSLATDYFLPIALLGMAVLAAYGFDWLRNIFFGRIKKKYITLSQWIRLAIPLFIVVSMSIPQLMLSRVSMLDSAYYSVYYITIILSFLFYILHKNSSVAKICFSSMFILLTLTHGWALYRASQPIVPREVTVIKNQQMNYVVAQDNSKPVVIDFANLFEAPFYNVSLINGYDSLYSSSILNRIQAINQPNRTLSTYRNNALILNNANKSTLFKNLGVRYILNKKPAEGYDEKVGGVYESNQLATKVYFAKNIRNESKERQLETIKTGDVTYHEVLIDGNFTVADQISTVKYKQTPNTLTIETDSPNGGLLFVAQTYNKDWKGTLDKKETIDIRSAYYDFSALDIPNGKHTITLEYRPAATLAGFMISGISITFASVGILYLVRRANKAAK